MNAAKVVVHEVAQADSMHMVLDFLAKAICQP